MSRFIEMKASSFEKLSIDSDGWLKRPLVGVIDVSDCCEDGTWSGYAFDGTEFRATEAIEFIEKEAFDRLKLAFEKAVKQRNEWHFKYKKMSAKYHNEIYSSLDTAEDEMFEDSELEKILNGEK